MTILSTLHQRIKLAKSEAHREDGNVMAIIVFVVLILLAIVLFLSKTNSGSADGSKQKVRLEASTLITQATSLRTSLGAMALNSTISWSSLAADYSTGNLALVNGSTSYKEGATLSQGPNGSNDSPINWHFAAYADPTRATPQVWAYTDATVTSAQCNALNDMLRPGGASNPLSSSAMNSAAGTSSQATDGFTYLQVEAGQRLTALQGMLANEACYDTGGGNFMFVARLN